MLMHSRRTQSRALTDDSFPEDAAILASVEAGRKGQFQVLVDRYKVALYRYLLYQTARADVAEDLAQEVFLRVFRAASAGGYAGRASVKTWIFTIARNCLRDFWRASQRNREVPDSSLADLQMQSLTSSEPDPSEEAAATERRDQVLRVLAELPAEQRQVTYLKFFGGLTMAEISEVTAAPLTTVKARLRYALTKLADKLTPSRGEL